MLLHVHNAPISLCCFNFVIPTKRPKRAVRLIRLINMPLSPAVFYIINCIVQPCRFLTRINTAEDIQLHFQVTLTGLKHCPAILHTVCFIIGNSIEITFSRFIFASFSTEVSFQTFIFVCLYHFGANWFLLSDLNSFRIRPCFFVKSNEPIKINFQMRF